MLCGRGDAVPVILFCYVRLPLSSLEEENLLVALKKQVTVL